MRLLFSLILLFCTFVNSAFAQRDAPVFNSYLPRTVVYNQRTSLDFEVTWHKAGGPVKQMDHAQMYVMVYLEKDEQEILDLANKKEHTNKKNDIKNMIPAVLAEKKLALVVETKLANPESDATQNLKKKIVGGALFDFEFSIDYSQLLKLHKGLANFDPKTVTTTPKLGTTYSDKVKLMLLVPTNDSPLATLIPEEQRKTYDFAHLMNSETSIQYLKPLPQRFGLRLPEDAEAAIAYID